MIFIPMRLIMNDKRFFQNYFTNFLVGITFIGFSIMILTYFNNPDSKGVKLGFLICNLGIILKIIFWFSL